MSKLAAVATFMANLIANYAGEQKVRPASTSPVKPFISQGKKLNPIHLQN
jgi:hypothetical protein